MRRRADPVQALRITAAVVTWGAVTLQLGLSLRLAAANGQSVAMGIATYLGFFTILTNILVAATLSVALVAPASPLGRFFARPVVAGGVLVPIVVVAIVYHVLLRDLWDPQGWQLVADVLLHYVVPALFVVYWWLAVPKEGLSWADVPKWMLYPAAYLVYLLLRGAILGHYPYPFLDVAELGLTRSLGNALLVLAGFVGVSVVVVTVGRRLSAARGGATRR